MSGYLSTFRQYTFSCSVSPREESMCEYMIPSWMTPDGNFCQPFPLSILKLIFVLVFVFAICLGYFSFSLPFRDSVGTKVFHVKNTKDKRTKRTKIHEHKTRIKVHRKWLQNSRNLGQAL